MEKMPADEKKYVSINFDTDKVGGVLRQTDTVEGASPDIYAQLNLLGELTPDVKYVTRWISWGKTQKPRYHKSIHELIVVIRGTGTFFVNDEKIPVKARDVMLVRPGELHGYCEGKERFEVISIHFRVTDVSSMLKKKHIKPDAAPADEFLAFLSQHYSSLRKLTLTEGSQIIKKAVHIHEEYTGMGAGARLMTNLGLVEMLILIARNVLFARRGSTLTKAQVNDRDRIMVEQMVLYIKHNYQHHIDADKLFDPFYLHPNYCRNIFKKVMGVPITAYILQIRLHNARIKIIDTDETLEAISQQCGFNDYFYFLRVFKKQYTYTAGSLRRNPTI